MVDAEGTYTFTYDNANELTGVYESGTEVNSYSYDSEWEPDRHRLLDHGDERNADLAGRHLYLRQSRKHDQRRTAAERSQRTRMIIGIGLTEVDAGRDRDRDVHV